MVLSDTQDTTSEFLVGCLIPIYITEDVAYYFGVCFVCGEPVEIGQIGMLDWQRKLVLHPQMRSLSTRCIEEYQQQYLVDNPDTTNMQLMIMFGISERTAKRRRVGVRKNGK